MLEFCEMKLLKNQYDVHECLISSILLDNECFHENYFCAKNILSCPPVHHCPFCGLFSLIREENVKLCVFFIKLAVSNITNRLDAVPDVAGLKKVVQSDVDTNPSIITNTLATEWNLVDMVQFELKTRLNIQNRSERNQVECNVNNFVVYVWLNVNLESLKSTLIYKHELNGALYSLKLN